MSDDMELLRLHINLTRARAWSAGMGWVESEEAGVGGSAWAQNHLRVSNGSNALTNALDRAASALEREERAKGAEGLTPRVIHSDDTGTTWRLPTYGGGKADFAAALIRTALDLLEEP